MKRKLSLFGILTALLGVVIFIGSHALSAQAAPGPGAVQLCPGRTAPPAGARSLVNGWVGAYGVPSYGYFTLENPNAPGTFKVDSSRTFPVGMICGEMASRLAPFTGRRVRIYGWIPGGRSLALTHIELAPLSPPSPSPSPSVSRSPSPRLPSPSPSFGTGQHSPSPSPSSGLASPSPVVSHSPQVSRPFIQFCVKHTTLRTVVAGAHIAMDSALLSSESEYDDHLVAGADGCTNPSFINTAALTFGSEYLALTTASGFITKTTEWVRTDASTQVIEISLDPESANAQLQFCVTNAVSTQPIGGALVIVEGGFALTGLVTGGDGCTNPGYINYTSLESGKSYVSTTQAVGFDSKEQSWTYAAQLNQRVYVALTPVSISSPSTGSPSPNPLPSPSSPISGRVSPSPTISLIPTPTTSNDPGTPGLVIENDAWIGNKGEALTDRHFTLGDNALLLTGRESNLGNQFQVRNYNLPATGALNWARLTSLMQHRINRSDNTRVTRVWKCADNQTITGVINLNSTGTSPLVPTSDQLTTSKSIWRLEKENGRGKDEGCSINFKDVQFVGTGTIINPGDKTIRITGKVAPRDSQSAATLGYVSPAGRAIIGHQTPLSQVVLFSKDTTLADTSAFVSNPIKIEHGVIVISRTMIFPDPATLVAEIVFRKPSGRYTVPPLFERFELPRAEQAP